MKVRLACGALLVSMALVPAAAAKPGNGNGHGHGNGGSSEAAKACAAQKKADKAAFQALWGKHAMRDCIRAGRSSGETATVSEQVTEFKNAAAECRAERDADPAVFATTYGTNANRKNAFGKCVSTKVHEEDAGETTPSA